MNNKGMVLRSGLLVLGLPFLAGCVNDAATLEIDGTREHVLSVIREQPYFWDKKVNLSMVVARMPACMRRHEIGPGSAATKVEVWQVESGAYIVRAGKRLYATETQNCVNFAKITEEPADYGKFIGTFQEKNGQFVFILDEAAKPVKPAEK